MSDAPDITRQLRRELDETRLRLVEAEETLEAIRQGEADGFVIAGPQGPQVFTLQGALEPYRLLIEQMSEGALTLSRDGVILYANQTFAAMLQLPPGRVIGTALRDFLPAADQPALAGLIATALNGSSSGEVSLRVAVGSAVTLRLGLHRLQVGAETLICAVATDITVEKQREIELRRLAELLETGIAERTADLAASRIAALNMMEEAIEGRKTIEEANRGLTLEITARKQEEAKLRQSEERYRSLFENMTEGYAHCRMIFADGEPPDLVYLSVNEAFGKLTGLRGVEGRKISEVIPGIQQTDPELLETYGRVARTGTPERFETFVEALAMWLSISVYSPAKDQFVAVFDVITERKRAEAALTVRNRIATIFLTVADDGMFNEVLKVVLDVMHSPFGVFGFIDEAGALVVPTMTRQIWNKCQVPEKTFVFPRATWGDSSWPRAVREKLANYSNEVSAKTPEGHVTLTRHMSLPILFQDEVIGLFQVANKETDYTAADLGILETIAGQVAPLLSARLLRERTQDSIRQLNAELEQRVLDRTAELEAANKELEAFSYSVSHDLRTPLRAMDGYSTALAEDYAGKLDENAQNYLRRIRAGSQRMAELIDDLLNLSHLSREAMHRERVDLKAMAREVGAELQRANPGRPVELVVAPALTADADGPMVRVVLNNLLGNAWKFTAGRAPARVEVGEREQGAERVFFVRDNGAGFDMAYAGKLFGAFQRLHSTQEFEGNGIGLALVQRIVRRHGGRVWAEGAVGQGATFYFTLQPNGGKETP